MPGNGDIGGGSCKVKFVVDEGPNDPTETWEYHDRRHGHQPRWRFVNEGTPNDPAGPGWQPVPARQVLQICWP